MTYAQFISEVVPNLPDSVAKAINEYVFEEMRLKVGTSIEKWLEAAAKAPIPTPGVQDGLPSTALAKQAARSGAMSDFSLAQPQNAPANTPAGTGRQPDTDWNFALMGGLASQSARRHFTAAEFRRFVREYRPNASASAARAVSTMLVSAGVLRRVSSGVFLNRRAVPPAELTEVATHIRAGAVISRHSVLGECGLLNNPSAIVMAVLPASASKRPRLGELETSTGDRFRFFGLAEKFFPATSEERWELLQPGRPCEMFRPEAAFLQWLHLASMRRSTLTWSPVDVDMEQLDGELLGKLAERWALQRHLGDRLAQADAANFGEADEALSPAPVMPTQRELDESTAARARLMARRPKTQ